MGIWNGIKLLDAQGQEVEGVFLSTIEELWDPGQTQWTLLFDPGRVKTGLQAHERMGRALEVGRSYELVIDGLEDVHHGVMQGAYIKTIHVAEADTLSPEIEKWAITSPPAWSTSPLTVSFQGIMDQFSLQQRLVVVDQENQPVPGEIEVGHNEAQWLFRPEEAWVPGTYRLLVNARLTDPSGNSLNGLFDHKEGTLRYAKEGEVLEVPILIK